MDLKNSDMAASPMGSASLANDGSKKMMTDMMRMTQPSDSSDYQAIGPNENKDGGYQSATNFSIKKGPSPMLHRKSSKGALSGKHGPNIGNKSSSSGAATTLKALPSINHSKQIDKLRSITGRSEDFGATATSSDSVQFSKPKIGMRDKTRGSASVATSQTKMQGRVGSRSDLKLAP